MSDNGTFDRIAGKAKEAAGKVTGNKETETEGKLQQAEGKIKEVAEDAKEHMSEEAQAAAREVTSISATARITATGPVAAKTSPMKPLAT